MTAEAARPFERSRWRGQGGLDVGYRVLPEETPVAIVHDATTTAVMMATPADLEDFGLGFSLAEGVISAASDLRDLDVVHAELGVEVRLWLRADASERLAVRRRRLVGPTGCGLCGIDSLEEAVKPPAPVPPGGVSIAAGDILRAFAALEAAQPLGRATHAVHAAALRTPAGDLIVREDVGRHNALDKLIGAVARAEVPASQGLLLLTSRLSVEMVQKAAALRAPVVCAISVPTALAVRTARDAGLTLVAVSRTDGFEVFSHPERIVWT